MITEEEADKLHNLIKKYVESAKATQSWEEKNKIVKQNGNQGLIIKNHEQIAHKKLYKFINVLIGAQDA